MNSKHFFLVVSLIISGIGHVNAQEEPSLTRQVTVNGVGIVEAQPDLVTISVSARVEEKISSNDSTSIRQERIQSLLNDVQAIADRAVDNGRSELGESIENVVVQQLSMRENGPRNARAMVATIPINITINDINKVPELINALAKAGIETFHRFTYDVSNRKALERTSLSLAIEDAKVDADYLATSFGMELGNPIDISSSDRRGNAVQMNVAMNDSMAISSKSMPISPSDLKITSQVRVVFDLYKEGNEIKE